MSNTVSTAKLSDLWENQSKDYLRLLNEEELILRVTEAIWALLESNELSKADLAEMLGVSRAYVTQLLNGSRNMTLRTLADIGFVLDRQISIDFKNNRTTTTSGIQTEHVRSAVSAGADKLTFICIAATAPGENYNAEKTTTSGVA